MTVQELQQSTDPLHRVSLPRPNNREQGDVFQTAATGDAAELKGLLSDKALSSLYYFTKTVLNFKELSPNFHYDRCQEIQDSMWIRKRGFLWPRGHFKSTIMKAYVLWILCGGGRGHWLKGEHGKPDIWVRTFDYAVPELDPRNHRFLFVGESDGRVVAALRNIKWHLTNNKMLRWLFPEVCHPEVIPKGVVWREDEICIPRSTDYDESTIRAIGVGSKITGFHGNTIVFDDVIGEKAAASEAVMLAANEMVEYCIGLSDKPDEVEWLFVGTRWKYGKADTYGKLMDEVPFWQDAEGDPHGIKWFVHSAILDNGEPAFPERFSIKSLTDIRQHLKDYKYSCQYLNTPATLEGGDFPANLVKSFIGEGSTLSPSDGSSPCQLTDLNRIIFYDLSSGGQSKDVCQNAIVVLGTHPDGRRFVLDAFLKNCGYRRALEEYYKLNDKYLSYRNYFEDIGAQKEILEIDLMVRVNGCELCRSSWDPGSDQKPPAKHRNLRLQGYSHKGFSGNKDDRIRLYLQSTVEEGRLYINSKLAELRVQVVSFPHYHVKDGVDALASAVHLSRAPASADEQKSQDLDQELVAAGAQESRVHTDRQYGGYA